MNNYKRGMVSVFAANIINMLISILTNFLLPKYLSIDTYSIIKTYRLYVSMIGIFHLGYIDGMYLKYGGKSLREIGNTEIENDLSTFRIFQIAITAVLLAAVLLIKNDLVYIAVVLTIASTNLATYFKYVYQAIGEFHKYSRLMNLTTLATFVLNIALLFIVKTDNYTLYVCGYVVINLIIWIVIEVYFERSIGIHLNKLIFSFQRVIENIKDGILLLFGNFTNMLLSSMDRWFVKALMDTYNFAQYSFACSMESMVNLAVTPITVTLYNYFCKVTDKKRITLLRNCMMVIGAGFIVAAFPAKFILEIYLTKYMDSSTVLFLLFGAQYFYIVIKSIFVNLYKARHEQKRYFIKLIVVLIIGFVLNGLFYALLHTKEAFAVGTFISAGIWFVFSARDFREYTLGPREILYSVIICVGFLTTGYIMGAIVGFLVYAVIYFASTFVLMKKEFRYLLDYALGFAKRKKYSP